MGMFSATGMLAHMGYTSRQGTVRHDDETKGNSKNKNKAEERQQIGVVEDRPRTAFSIRLICATLFLSPSAFYFPLSALWKGNTGLRLFLNENNRRRGRGTRRRLGVARGQKEVTHTGLLQGMLVLLLCDPEAQRATQQDKPVGQSWAWGSGHMAAGEAVM